MTISLFFLSFFQVSGCTSKWRMMDARRQLHCSTRSGCLLSLFKRAPYRATLLPTAGLDNARQWLLMVDPAAQPICATSAVRPAPSHCLGSMWSMLEGRRACAGQLGTGSEQRLLDLTAGTEVSQRRSQRHQLTYARLGTASMNGAPLDSLSTAKAAQLSTEHSALRGPDMHQGRRKLARRPALKDCCDRIPRAQPETSHGLHTPVTQTRHTARQFAGGAHLVTTHLIAHFTSRMPCTAAGSTTHRMAPVRTWGR